MKPLELTRRGPGLWQVEVEVGDGFVASGHMTESDEAVVAVAVDHPFSPELANFGSDDVALATLAEQGGGRVIDDLGLILAPGGQVPTMQPLRLPLLLLALFLYLLSVLLLRLPRDTKARALTLIRRRGKSQAPPPPPAEVPPVAA